MTDSTGWTPPPPPGGPPPGGPPGNVPPGGVPPAGPPPGYPPSGPPPGGGYPETPSGPAWGTPYAPPRSTNTLAVVSLVAGCAQFVVCPIVGAVVAIVTGHIARGQIRRTGEQGNGLAVAGLILGYIGAALTALALAGLLVFVFAFSDDVAQEVVQDDAEKFGRSLVNTAALQGESPRDPALIRAVYEREVIFDGCCNEDDVALPNGTSVLAATEDDWESAGWQLEFSRSIFYTEHVCLTVPESSSDTALVVEGQCDAVP
jgi:hypothetical protein